MKSIIQLVVLVISIFIFDLSAYAANATDKDSIAVSISPLIFNYISFNIFPSGEVKNNNTTEDRNGERYYPSKISLEYSFKISLDNFMDTGAIMSLFWTGKYPFESDFANDGKSKSFNTGFNNYWHYLGLDVQYQFYKSFIHITQDKDTYGYNFTEIDSDLRYKTFTTNAYVRLFDLYGKNSSLASVIEPLRKDNTSWVSVLFYLVLSYDYFETRSSSPLVSDITLPYFNDHTFTKMVSHLYNASLTAGYKYQFFNSRWFIALSVSLVNAYLSRKEFYETDNGTVKENSSGVESMFTSFNRYMQYQKNPLEGYTKNILRLATGYNDGRFYIYGEYFYDVKNIKSDEYYVQYASYFYQVCLGFTF